MTISKWWLAFNLPNAGNIFNKKFYIKKNQTCSTQSHSSQLCSQLCILYHISRQKGFLYELKADKIINAGIMWHWKSLLCFVLIMWKCPQISYLWWGMGHNKMNSHTTETGWQTRMHECHICGFNKWHNWFIWTTCWLNRYMIKFNQKVFNSTQRSFKNYHWIISLSREIIWLLVEKMTTQIR